MNSLADNYLLYISKSINNYCKIVLKNNEFIDENKTIDVIYDYLNEVFLLKKSINKVNYNQCFKTKLSDEDNSLLNLLTEYSLIDRIKLKDKSIKKSCIFVVDTIKFFINMEIYVYKKNIYSYDQAYVSVMKNNKFLDKASLKNCLDNNKCELIKTFDINVKTKKQLNETNLSFNFNSTDLKISGNYVFNKLNYYNEDILNYNSREVKFVEDNYKCEIYFNCLETLTLKILNELINGKNKKHFIYIPEYILKKKNNVMMLFSILNIYSISNSICLIIDANYYLKYKNSNELNSNYEIALIIKNYISENLDLININYLIFDELDDQEFSNTYKKIEKKIELIFNASISNEMKQLLNKEGYKYIVCKKVKYE